MAIKHTVWRTLGAVQPLGTPLTTLLEAPTHTAPITHPDGFVLLDEAHRQQSLTPVDIARYGGQYALVGATLLDTPPDVLAAGNVLTNPSQVEKVRTVVDGVEGEYDFAYFRCEPARNHLGKTVSVPYIILPDRDGKPRLVLFTEARTVEGEDPRLIPNFKIKGANGVVRRGWGVVTVVATPKADNPAEAESIRQVFYWGETLATLGPVWEVPDLKNNILCHVSAADDDPRLHVIGRPHPHLSYGQYDDLFKLTKKRILADQIITSGMLPPKVLAEARIHFGGNSVHRSGPDRLVLNIHEAYAPITPQGEGLPKRKDLHYRLAQYGLELLPRRFRRRPKAILTPLGTVATRADFPSAEPKLFEHGVNYEDVAYGSVGSGGSLGEVGLVVVGLSDSRIGFAKSVRRPRPAQYYS